MKRLFFILLWICIFSHLAVRSGSSERLRHGRRRPWNLCLTLLTVPLILLIGLRSDYNDTAAYIDGFNNAPTLVTFWTDPDNYALLHNPLFQFYTALMRTLTDNYHVYFMVSATFLIVSVVYFLWQIAERDTFLLSVFTYYTLGTCLFSLAAMKQTLAMAILGYAVLALIDKKYTRFAVITFIAGLVHTYAWFFLVILLLTGKPWRLRTFLVVFTTLLIMLTFRSTITRFLDYAEELGKGASEELVFSGQGINIFRVIVYAIVPVTTFLFQPILTPQMERKHYIMLHMSIISFMFMLLASIDGANMFGRMARYFEIGTVYMFPWTVRHLFNEKSQRIVVGAFVVAFTVFFTYQYLNFDTAYRSIAFGAFLKSLF